MSRNPQNQPVAGNSRQPVYSAGSPANRLLQTIRSSIPRIECSVTPSATNAKPRNQQNTIWNTEENNKINATRHKLPYTRY